MTISELKEQLKKAGHTEESLEGLKKQELSQLLEQSQLIVDAVEGNSEITAFSGMAELEDNILKTPNPYDKEWTDYVLGLLDPEREMDNKNPKTDGLRRVAHQLYGGFSVKTNVVDSPRIDNGYRATVVVSVKFADGMEYDGAADVYSGNTDKKFAVHAVATAETRAEGRALRRALKLTKVLAAEELYNADTDEPTGLEENSAMPSTMLTSLELIANNTGVDLLKVAQKQGYNINSVKELTKEQGLALSKVLGDIKRKVIELTDDIKK